MRYTMSQIVLIVALVSVAGWVMETFQAAAKNKRFVNRGFLVP